MINNLKKLESTKQQFYWFSETPFETILKEVENTFKQKSDDAQLLHLEVTSDAQWLTTASSPNNTASPTRIAVAFECKFGVFYKRKEMDLKGVFSWAIVNIDTNVNSKMWLDIDGTLKELVSSQELRHRIYYDRKQ